MATRAVVVDGDNTLWRGRVTEGIGKAILMQELRRLHLPTVARGLKGKSEIEEMLAIRNGFEGEMIAQEMLYGLLLANGLGRRDEMYRIAADYIRGRLIGTVFRMVDMQLGLGGMAFLATAAGTSAATFAQMDLFRRELTGSRHNREIFDDSGRLRGFKTAIASGEEKLHATEQMLAGHGLTLRDCRVVGDSGLDRPMLMSAQKAYASPYATDEVKAIKGIVQIRA
ncbi:MAG: hypothetical protein KGH72_00360 [Candidatus Micrarchaeota archaeon]|nr:hypothetical protein [Candidatus Micrarchaeota archaeon]